jgi:hypothetical protein
MRTFAQLIYESPARTHVTEPGLKKVRLAAPEALSVALIPAGACP